jgi:hypothetical protein
MKTSEQEKEIRGYLEQFNKLNKNMQENLVLYCLIGIHQLIKEEDMR